VAQALTEHADALAGEVLAPTVHARQAGAGEGVPGPEGARFWLAAVSAR
jgi:isoleucyl-tRNA synthetase